MEQLEIVEGLIQEKPQVSPVSPADYVTKTEGSKYYGDALKDTNINELGRRRNSACCYTCRFS